MSELLPPTPTVPAGVPGSPDFPVVEVGGAAGGGDVQLGPPAPGQAEPGPFPEPLDGGTMQAWRIFWNAVGRGVPQQVNRSRHVRRRIRALGVK